MDLTRVLFLCVGNAIRSQMAEGFARCYGSDVMVARSAGLAPAPGLAPFTRKVMAEKNIDLGEAYPKAITEFDLKEFDLIVNMSGITLARLSGPAVREWKVPDPIGGDEERYRQTANQIEMLVMGLILELRKARNRRLASFDTQLPPRSQ
ncbi:MAG: arsenate reductase ArsC [Bryobacteraceae bacterium]|nr:arsenate reductase ArsC [Bryobacteraceae bacterium]MDW8379734.1 arsenate reductase ArsC [Bryobacterales bacterium]